MFTKRFLVFTVSYFFRALNSDYRNKLEHLIYYFVINDFVTPKNLGDNQTELEIGLGNGFARTSRETLTLTKKFRRLRKEYGLNYALDLGAGDGVILRYFEISRLIPIGIEGDPFLSSLLLENVPKSKLIQLSIDDPRAAQEVTRIVGNKYLNGRLLVYVFNPASSSIVVEALTQLAQYFELILVLKNPKSMNQILNSVNLDSYLLSHSENYAEILIGKRNQT